MYANIEQEQKFKNIYCKIIGLLAKVVFYYFAMIFMESENSEQLNMFMFW